MHSAAPAVLAPGKKIDRGGIYIVDMDRYHDDCCDGLSVSGSDLIRMERGCPALALAHHYLAGDRRIADATVDMLIGAAAHIYVCEGPEAFDRAVGIYPYFRTGHGKPTIADQREAWERANGGKIALSRAEGDLVYAMARAIAADPLAMRAFTGGRPELSLAWRDDATGLWLKSRPDYLSDDRSIAWNLKTARDPAPAAFARQAFDLGYDQSAALTIDAIKAVCGVEADAGFVVVGKKPPHLVAIVTMRAEDIAWGRMKNARALRRFAECAAAGVWPGYGTDVVEIAMPPWHERALQARHSAGEFEPPPHTEDEEPA